MLVYDVMRFSALHTRATSIQHSRDDAALLPAGEILKDLCVCIRTHTIVTSHFHTWNVHTWLPGDNTSDAPRVSLDRREIATMLPRWPSPPNWWCSLARMRSCHYTLPAHLLTWVFPRCGKGGFPKGARAVRFARLVRVFLHSRWKIYKLFYVSFCFNWETCYL